MKKFALLGLFFPAILLGMIVSLPLFAQTENAAPVLKEIAVSFDRESQIWETGENAQFTITVKGEDGQAATAGTLTVYLSNDGISGLFHQTYNLAEANPVTVTFSVDYPAHVLAQISADSGIEGVKPISTLAGFSFSPEKIEPGLPKPEDFDQFWTDGKAEVRALPLDLVQTRIDSLCNDKHEVYAVNFATVNDQRVYGYLSIPAGEGPFPALVNVPGAGPGTGPDYGFADEGFAVLNMNVFPYEVPLDGQERKKLYDDFNAGGKDGLRYCYWDAEDRDRYFFRPAYLGIDRAIDWFADQPFVDKNRIGYYGTSQGGASGLILSGMNKNIKYALASVPALCDHAALLKGRSPGWPRLMQTYKDNAAVQEASRYLDAVNFARDIHIPIKVTVGFIDQTCCPSSVWSAYNVIPSSQKEMVLEQKMGHRNGKGYDQAFDWLKKSVKGN